MRPGRAAVGPRRAPVRCDPPKQRKKEASAEPRAEAGEASAALAESRTQVDNMLEALEEAVAQDR